MGRGVPHKKRNQNDGESFIREVQGDTFNL